MVSLVRDDLRIGNAITPSHYILDLAVDVRRYNGAVKSAFFGKISPRKIVQRFRIRKSRHRFEHYQTSARDWTSRCWSGHSRSKYIFPVWEYDVIMQASITYLDNTILRTTGGRLNSLRETVTLFENKEFEPREARLIVSLPIFH